MGPFGNTKKRRKKKNTGHSSKKQKAMTKETHFFPLKKEIPPDFYPAYRRVRAETALYAPTRLYAPKRGVKIRWKSHQKITKSPTIRTMYSQGERVRRYVKTTLKDRF